MPAWLLDSSGRAKLPGSGAGDSDRAGNDNFRAFYAYDASWGTTNYGATAPASGDLWVGLEAKASASAGGWVFGSGDITVLDAYARIGTAHGREGHFNVLDLAIWEQPPDVEWIAQRAHRAPRRSSCRLSPCLHEQASGAASGRVRAHPPPAGPAPGP